MKRFPDLRPEAEKLLHRGTVIPAHPLALDASRQLDERRQRALSRYYLDSGAGGIAVGVHTTQFEIRDAGIDLYEPVLRMTAAIASIRCSSCCSLQSSSPPVLTSPKS